MDREDIQDILADEIDRCNRNIQELQKMVTEREGSEVHRLMGKIEGVNLIRDRLRGRLLETYA